MFPVLKGFAKAPPRWACLVRLLRVPESHLASGKRLAAVLRTDPASAQAVLSRSQGSCFGTRGNDTDLEEAVERLGLVEAVKTVALRAYGEIVVAQPETYAGTGEDLLDDAMATAVLMEFLAHETGGDPLHAYLVGLCHNLGVFPIDQLLRQIRPNATLTPPDDFLQLCRWEREQIGLEHPKVGAILLDTWGLAEEICQPVGCHGHPMLAGTRKRIACQLNLCRQVVPYIRHPYLHPYEELDLPIGVLSIAGLRQSEVAAFIPGAIAWYRHTHAWVETELLRAAV